MSEQPATAAREVQELEMGTGLPAGRGVLDTSTVILLGELTDATALPAEPLITTVTLAELSVGPLVAGDERERSARQAHLQQAEADFDPLPFDAGAARAFGRVAASLRRAGRKSTARSLRCDDRCDCPCRGSARLHLQSQRLQRLQRHRRSRGDRRAGTRDDIATAGSTSAACGCPQALVLMTWGKHFCF